MRAYNKFYVNKNREEGSEKILLGYQDNGREFIFKKNQETYFHIPTYTDTIALIDTTIIENGATGGPFPAASDRIFKNKRNYGNVTNQGNPSDIADGVWFCSWLYKDSSGNLQWMDRYYNPGKFNFAVLEFQLLQGPTYEANDPVFRDVPSTLLLEPGVLYRYFHIGEDSAQDIISTYAGLSGERLLMNLSDWGKEKIDLSQNNLQVAINTFTPTNQLYDISNEVQRVNVPIINFNGGFNIEASIEWNTSYTPLDEFTLSVWAQNEDWKESPTTQLVGNFSSKGGYGIFLDSLESYPFFVLPETNYGHLLFVNQQGNAILDVDTSTVFASASPQHIALNSDDHLLVCYNNSIGTIAKFDSTGTVLAVANNFFVLSPSLTSTESPITMLCGQEDEVVVITNFNRYFFDVNLKLKRIEGFGLTSLSAVAAYQYNKQTNTATLIVKDNDVIDLKFIEQTEWSIKKSTKKLYRNNTIFANQLTNCKKIQIDPDEKIWVFYENNSIAVFDTTTATPEIPILNFTVGANVDHPQVYLSFLNIYDKTNNEKKWVAVLYYSNESLIYLLNLDGTLLQTININSLFNLTILQELNQNVQLFEYFSKGDFTGYEYKRVFKNVFPYNGEQQLILKTSVKEIAAPENKYSIYKCYVSTGNWDPRSWQHVAVIYQNKVFSVCINGVKEKTLQIPGNYVLAFDQQPPFFIGSSVGSKNGANRENGVVVNIFNGKFADIKLYNYAIPTENLEMFLRASNIADDLYWSLPIPTVQYIESIERMFKNKLPGHKSGFFKLKLVGTNIKDSTTRGLIEEQVKELISQVSPAYTDLVRIDWIE
jgi:hypothetical protein